MIRNERKIGIILSYAGQFVHIATSLLYTPIMLRILGRSEYGLYQLVFSVVSYLSLLSLGFGSSYLRFYSRYEAHNQKREIEKLNGMFMIIFLSISAICLFCGFFMVKDINIIFGDKLTAAEYETAKILMSLLIVNLALTFPNSVFNCYVTSQEKFIFQKFIIFLQNLLNPFLALPLLLLGFGSVGMVLATTFLTFSVLISNIWFCFRRLHMKFCYKNLQFSLFKEMWVFTFFIFLNQIIDQINWNVDKFLLGRIAGTSAVAIYGVGGQINNIYMQLSTSVSNVFIPKVNKIVAETNDNKVLTGLFTKVGRMQFIILFMILSGFIFFGKAFIGFWAGEGYEEAYGIALFLIAPVTIPLIQNLGLEIQRAKNMHRTRSVVYFFIAIMNVFASIPLIYFFGPTGAAVGTALSLFLGNICFMNWYYDRRIGLDIIYFWKKIFKFLPSLVIPFIFGIYIKFFVQFDSLIQLVIWGILYCTVYVVSLYFFGMNKEEKSLLDVPLRKIKRKFSKI